MLFINAIVLLILESEMGTRFFFTLRCFKVATVRHAHHVIDDNVTNTSNHQSVTYPANFFEGTHLN